MNNKRCGRNKGKGETRKSEKEGEGGEKKTNAERQAHSQTNKQTNITSYSQGTQTQRKEN